MITMPIILLTVTCCIKQKKDHSTKVIFAKTAEGTFKASVCDTESKNCYVLDHSMATSTIGSDVITTDKLYDQVLPKGNNTQSNQTLDQGTIVSSDVVMNPNPSYNAVEPDEGLCDSLYIYPDQPPNDDDITEDILSEQHGVEAGRRECENALYAVRECYNTLYAGVDMATDKKALTKSASQNSYDYIAAQNYEFSTEQTECDGVEMKPNPSYGKTLTRSMSPSDYDYIATPTGEDLKEQTMNTGEECDNVRMTHNPSYGKMLTRSTSPDGYDYIATEDAAKQEDLYGVREYDNATYKEDVPTNRNPVTVLKTSRQNGRGDETAQIYEELYEYSYVRELDNLNYCQLTAEGSTDVDNGKPHTMKHPTPPYNNKITVLKTPNQ